MKPSLLILPFVAVLAVGNVYAHENDRKSRQSGDLAEDLSARLIEKYDKDLDGDLSGIELTKALKAMHRLLLEGRDPENDSVSKTHSSTRFFSGRKTSETHRILGSNA